MKPKRYYLERAVWNKEGTDAHLVALGDFSTKGQAVRAYRRFEAKDYDVSLWERKNLRPDELADGYGWDWDSEQIEVDDIAAAEGKGR